MNSSKLQYRFMLLFFLYYAAYAIPYTQVIPFLKSLDYDAVARGYILAGIAVMATVGQFLCGYFSDRYHKVKPYLLRMNLLTGIVTFLIYLFAHQTFFLHLTCVSLLGGAMRSALGLLDQWILENKDPLAKNYGKMRALGAVGWAVGSPLAAFAVSFLGYQFLIVAYLLVMVLCFMAGKRLPDVNKENNKKINFNDVHILLQNKRYVLLLWIYLTIFITATADGYTVVEKMLELGADTWQVSFKWAIQSLAEAPVFLLTPKLLKKFSALTLLKVGTVMFFFRFLSYGFAQNVSMIIVFSLFQTVTLPFVVAAGKVLFNEESGEDVKATAQMISLATYMGVAAFITPLLAGYAIEWFGYDITLFGFAGFVLLPIVLLKKYSKMRKGR